MNIAQALLDKIYENNPSSTYLNCEENSLSYGQLIEAVSARMQQLAEHNIKQGDIVFANADNLYFWGDLIAIWAYGAIAAPIENGISEQKLGFQIEKVSPALLLSNTISTKLCPVVNTAKTPAHAEEIIVATKTPNDIAAIYFTSGSTGKPKAAALTHAGILGNARATLGAVKLSKQDHLCIATPFHFTSAICHFLSSILSCAQFTCTLKKLFYADLYNYVCTSKANTFGGSPVQFNWLSQCLTGNEKINWMMSSGDHLSTKIIELLHEKLANLKLFVVYGLTELSGRFCILKPVDLVKNIGSVGKPIEGLTISIVDDNDNTLPANTIGRVIAGGDYIFTGYKNDQQKTDNAKTNIGFITGDLGQINDEGFLFLCGRNDDVFKCAGQKVSILPIVDKINEISPFKDFAVMPVENDLIDGKVPCVFYVVDPEKPFKRGLVARHLRENLEAIYLPHDFIEVDAIPRTGSGKVDRQALKLKVIQHKP
jgi:long-chain acyl-CoA synthetase